MSGQSATRHAEYRFIGQERHRLQQRLFLRPGLRPDAAAFIENHRDKPWFVYLPFGAVHAPPARRGDLPPQSSPPRYRDRFADVADAKRRTYLGMELAMDDAIGVVLPKLRELHLEENTLIFFMSDNGGPTWQTTSRNDPWRRRQAVQHRHRHR